MSLNIVYILQQAIKKEFIRQPPPQSMTMILVDDDGLVVSNWITYEGLEDVPEIAVDALYLLMEKRKELRSNSNITPRDVG